MPASIFLVVIFGAARSILLLVLMGREVLYIV